ncbi:MAG: PDZ domain-containing protein [Cyanobacteria bacterium SZAS-4]|nr:PDZ domain-containing protein [Cyanobacteria bacterium SZAS-4]
MKFLFALLTTLFLAQAMPANATMLVGSVQYRDAEGRIGVRINHYGRVHKVHAHSPAEIAGIQKGDVITSVDGLRKGFVGKIHGTPGTVAHLTLRRAGEELSFSVPRVEVFQIQSEEKPPLLVQR